MNIKELTELLKNSNNKYNEDNENYYEPNTYTNIVYKNFENEVILYDN